MYWTTFITANFIFSSRIRSIALMLITWFLQCEKSAAFAYKHLMHQLFWRNKLMLFASREISPSLLESVKGEIKFRRNILESVRNSSGIIAVRHFSIKFSHVVSLVFWTCEHASGLPEHASGLPVTDRLNISVWFFSLRNANAYCNYFIKLMFVKRETCWT